MEGRETEVVAKATRRRFTAEYKRQVLQEAERAQAAREVGALLRREGLYSSHLASWRAARERGEVAGLSAKRRGPKPKPRDERDRRIGELEREVAKLHKHLERAEAVIEVHKKTVGAAGACASRVERDAVMTAVTELAPRVGVAFACRGLQLPRPTY